MVGLLLNKDGWLVTFFPETKQKPRGREYIDNLRDLSLSSFYKTLKFLMDTGLRYGKFQSSSKYFTQSFKFVIERL